MNWAVELAAEARADLAGIITYSRRHYGAPRARAYRAALEATVRDLAGGPDAPGSTHRRDLGDEYFARHVSLRFHRGRHLFVYRVGQTHPGPTILVVRILHDAMDIARHLPPADKDPA